MKIDMPILLQHWAMDIAKPYLEGHHPDRLTSDTTDPCKGRLQYTESDLMDIKEEDGRPAALPEWKLVEPRKNKASANTAKAINHRNLILKLNFIKEPEQRQP